MSAVDILVQSAPASVQLKTNRRVAVRIATDLEATSHAVEDLESIAWGAVVNDISAGGLGIILCYPFRPGTSLGIELKGSDGVLRTVLVRVVHVRDHADGAWHLGCEFVKPLSDVELNVLMAE